MFINERKRNVNTYLISNFDSLEAALQIYRPRQLPSLPRPKYVPGFDLKRPPSGQYLQKT